MKIMRFASDHFSRFKLPSGAHKKLRTATDGNIGMLFALMGGVLFLFVGGALDYTRWNAVRTDMLESMDAASLAVAQLASDDETLTDTELEAFGDQFFLENFNYEDDMKPGWDVSFNVQSSGNIRTCMVGQIDTFLLGVVHIEELDMNKCVEITPEGAGRIELAMVLDVTGSMDWNDSSGNHKMTALKDAVDELLDVLYDPGQNTSDNVRLGIVPFNQHVNVGGASSWDDANWGDRDAEAYYHGYRFFHVDSSGNVDASTKVNHYRLFAGDPNATWDGCVEARPYPLDEMDTVPGVAITAGDVSNALVAPSSADEPDQDVRDAFTNAPSFPHGMTAAEIADAANSKWVPVYLGDTPDCNSYKECENANSYYDDDGYVDGVYWDGEWFTDPDSDPVLTWVQESSYASHNASNQRFVIGDRLITNYDFGGDNFKDYLKVVRHFREVINGTTTDAPFSDWLAANRVTHEDQEYIVRTGYPGVWNSTTEIYEGKFDESTGNGDANYDDCPTPVTPLTNDRSVIEAAKTALSPDGGTNIPIGAIWGWRLVSPQAPFTEAIGPGETDVDNTTESDWQKAVLIMTDGENDFNDTNTHWGSYISAFGYESEERMGDGINEADSGANDMEDEAYNKLLRICRRMKEEDILVYAIVFDVAVGSTVEDRMKSCASESTSPFFFNAANGTDLEEAFGEIAADLVKLHVSE